MLYKMAEYENNISNPNAKLEEKNICTRTQSGTVCFKQGLVKIFLLLMKKDMC